MSLIGWAYNTVVYWQPHDVCMLGGSYGLVTRTRSGSAMICGDNLFGAASWYHTVLATGRTVRGKLHSDRPVGQPPKSRNLAPCRSMGYTEQHGVAAQLAHQSLYTVIGRTTVPYLAPGGAHTTPAAGGAIGPATSNVLPWADTVQGATEALTGADMRNRAPARMAD
jgi:hypothetical protein